MQIDGQALCQERFLHVLGTCIAAELLCLSCISIERGSLEQIGPGRSTQRVWLALGVPYDLGRRLGFFISTGSLTVDIETVFDNLGLGCAAGRIFLVLNWLCLSILLLLCNVQCHGLVQ